MMAQRVGFVGLGIMGRAMAENVLRAGFPLTVYNRTPDKAAILAELGARVAATPRELAEASDVVVAMLSGPEAVYAVLAGEDGAARGLDRGKIFVNMSTISPAYAREIAGGLKPLGVQYVDAPVSGSKRPAEEGSLVVLAGGADAAIDAVEPLLLAVGRKVVRCGAVGQGSLAKMGVNLLLAGMAAGLAEALALVRKGGLDGDILMDIVASGALACPLFAAKREMLASGYYPPQFPLKHMAKDLKFVLDTAYDTGAAAPLAAVLSQLYGAGRARGLGDQDFAAVARVLEELGGGRAEGKG
nr:NAD(P)-dependent oxidoreductase [Desulfocurvus sp.]